MIWLEKDGNHSTVNFHHGRSGLRIKVYGKINQELRNEVKDFASWLRKHYCFPIRVPVYLHDKECIRAADGEYVSAVFFEPAKHDIEPYIKLSAKKKSTALFPSNNEIADLLFSMTHELTHYYQWVTQSSMSDRGRERQATNHARRILWKYAIGQYPALYTLIVRCIPKSEEAFCLIKVLESDRCGRTLFECRIVFDYSKEEHTVAYAICQTIFGSEVYYYSNDCFALTDRANGLNQQAIDALKCRNAWNEEYALSLCAHEMIFTPDECLKNC